VRPHVVEVMTEVTSQESIDHPVTGQEFPTLYVANKKGGTDLPLLLDAGGGTITLANPANDGFFYGNFTSPAPWVSWQNATKDYGVGLGHDQGIKDFQGWRADSPYFHNVRGQMSFGLPAGGTVRGLSYLALGGFSTVSAQLGSVLAKRPPFGHLDTPAGAIGYKAGAPVSIAGWTLDTSGVKEVEAQVDGVTVAKLPVSKSRPDVCAVYPAYGGCPSPGFAGDVPTTGLSACPHLLRVIAKDGDGNVTVLGERVLTPM